jgi:flavin-dependent trigonelline monooxygenase, oxygenase component
MDIGLFLSYLEIDPSESGRDLYQRQLEQAKIADRQGFDVIWVPEHHVIHLMKAPSPMLTTIQIAGQVGCRVGPAVIVVPYHHPLVVAGDIAVADTITDGRLEVAVGRGAYRDEFDRLGIEFTESRDRFAESMEILGKIWASPDGGISHQGTYYSFDETYVWPRPVQLPHPPVWVGGQTAGTIEWAVGAGYHVLNALQRRPHKVVEQVASVFQEAREKAGRAAGEVKLGVSRHAFVVEHEAEIAPLLERVQRLHRIHTHMHNHTAPLDSRGYVPDLPIDDAPTDAELREWLLIGTADEVRDKLHGYQDLGIDHVALWMDFGAAQEQICRSIELFGAEVLPRLQAREPVRAQAAP